MLPDAQIVAFLREAIPGLIAVYRFGSTASGQTHAGSDVDLAVLAAGPMAARRVSTCRSVWRRA